MVLSHIALSSGSGGHHAVVDTPDPEILSNYSAKVSESLTLDPPKILSESGMSVGDLIRKVYKNPDHQLVLTVLVNNYSRFKLSNLKTSLNENCAYTNQVKNQPSVLKDLRGKTCFDQITALSVVVLQWTLLLSVAY